MAEFEYGNGNFTLNVDMGDEESGDTSWENGGEDDIDLLNALAEIDRHVQAEGSYRHSSGTSGSRRRRNG